MYVKDFVLPTIYLCAFVLPTIRGILFQTKEITLGSGIEDIGIERQTMMDSVEATENPPWNYSDVEAWRINYPNCGGRRQSPINIDFSQTIPSNSDTTQMFSNLRYVGYENIPEDMTITNNGHTIEITGVWQQRPYITGGGLRGQYVFEQFHFHWGDGEPFPDEGAEHTFNGRTFPLEMHIVHYKRRYGSLERALQFQDGLAVIARLFWVNGNRRTGFDSFVDSIRLVTQPGTEQEIDPFPLSDFQFNFNDNYLLYRGSLTTPPCTEVVTWIIPTTRLWVTNDVLREFRSVQLNDGDTRNFRPVQPLNGRRILLVRYNNDFSPFHGKRKRCFLSPRY